MSNETDRILSTQMGFPGTSIDELEQVEPDENANDSASETADSDNDDDEEENETNGNWCWWTIFFCSMQHDKNV